ncbi:MAG: prepilin peptidase, partial [Myxococcota bacterium]
MKDKEAMTPESIILIFAFLVGAVVGSFLNVIIHRVPRGMSIVSPPSSCSSCGEQVRWYHNVPIVSYIVLKGRCARCEAPFSFRYPVVELLTAVAAVASVVTLGLTPVAVRTFVFICFLIALTYVDLEHWLLPHALTWPGIALGLATAWLPGAPGLGPAAIGAAAGLVGFWLLRVLASAAFGKEALGGGDLWLLAMIGAFLGWQPLLPVVFLASLQGSVIGLVLLMLGKRKGQAEIASSHEEEGKEVAASTESEGKEEGEAPEQRAEDDSDRSEEQTWHPLDEADPAAGETRGGPKGEDERAAYELDEDKGDEDQRDEEEVHGEE